VATDAPVRQSFVRDLVALTKPRIISLLLVTTIAPMYVAGSPSSSAAT
jgi:protoheme IX farnesyltransferase